MQMSSPGRGVALPAARAQLPRGEHGSRRALAGLGSGLLWVLVLGLVLALTMAVYEAIATERDSRAYPPPGQMVDVGGRRLHLSCTGEGSPTVVFEAGLANMSADWSNVQPRVAATTRACAYDRAGIAWSDGGPSPRDPAQIARELHALLRNTGVPAPYVLAGQSFGGLYVRLFADLYPNEVAGMVLVDASHPDMWARLPPDVTAGLVPDRWQGLAYRGLARLGFLRLTSAFPADCGLAPRQCAEERAWMVSARRQDAYVAEMGAPDRDAQVRATQTIGSRPLVVLTASDHSDIFGPHYAAEVESTWREMQDELAALSTDTAHHIVEGATHGSLQTEHAALTSAAIGQVVQAVRTGRPLAP
jgi:pimeloyl-ACP methyl ester carboxylesterase